MEDTSYEFSALLVTSVSSTFRKKLTMSEKKLVRYGFSRGNKYEWFSDGSRTVVPIMKSFYTEHRQHYRFDGVMNRPLNVVTAQTVTPNQVYPNMQQQQVQQQVQQQQQWQPVQHQPSQLQPMPPIPSMPQVPSPQQVEQPVQPAE